jgi:hypothetical protein
VGLACLRIRLINCDYNKLTFLESSNCWNLILLRRSGSGATAVNSIMRSNSCWNEPSRDSKVVVIYSVYRENCGPFVTSGVAVHSIRERATLVIQFIAVHLSFCVPFCSLMHRICVCLPSQEMYSEYRYSTSYYKVMLG